MYIYLNDRVQINVNASENNGYVKILQKSGSKDLCYIIIDSTGTSSTSLSYIEAVLPETGKE